jgi:hypothetical protein
MLVFAGGAHPYPVQSLVSLLNSLLMNKNCKVQKVYRHTSKMMGAPPVGSSLCHTKGMLQTLRISQESSVKTL